MSRLLLKIGAIAIATALANTEVHAAVGRTPGSFSVSNTGSATYSIPIVVPPGPRGIQPTLALVYNSSAGSSSVGVGWNVSGLSSITRCNRTYAQDAHAPAPVTLTSSDVFCLDGNRLRLTSAAGYGQDGSTYQTEIANFSNVTAHVTNVANGPDSFTVQGKDGLIYEYGDSTDNSRVVATTTSIATAWLLHSVSDRSGNKMVVTYLPPSASLTGVSVPSVISWTRSSAGSSTFNYTLTFNYSAVSEVLYAGSVAGTAVVNQELLSNITIAKGGATIKRYALTYEPSPTTTRSRLKQVRECSDTAELDCLLPTAITYQDGQAGFAASATPVLGASPSVLTNAYDFNGDGRNDLLFANGSTWAVSFASASGFGPAVSTNISTAAPLDFLNKILIGDLNGSGQDVLMFPNGASWSYYRWNGASFVIGSTGLPYNSSASSFVLTDVDGDGLPDVVSVTFTPRVSLTVWTNLNTSSGGGVSFNTTAINSYTQPNAPFLGSAFVSNGASQLSGIRHVDFNGDGRKDVLLSTATTTGVAGQSRLISQGTTFSAFSSGTAPNNRRYLNWNNDSCVDFMDNSTSSSAVIYIAGCDGNTLQVLNVGYKPLEVLDWDGDGRMDILTFNSATQKLQVLLSTGTGLSAPVATTIPYSSATAYMAFDADGDGLDDVTQWDFSTVGVAYHNASGTPPDLVSKIEDGFGNSVRPSYVSLPNAANYTRAPGAAFPEQDAMGPFYVTSQVVRSDGIGGSYTESYSYTGARQNLQGYGFQGYQTIRVSDDRAGSLVRKTEFETIFPKTGMPLTADTFQHDGTTLVAHASFDNQSTNLSTATGNERKFVFTHSSTVQRYEVGGPKNALQIGTETTTTTYDSFGNATQVVTTLTDNDATSPYVGLQWTSTTDVTITPDATANWCLAQPTRVVVTKTTPNGPIATRSISRRTDITPDYVNCRPTQVDIEPNSSAYHVTQVLGYDTFGNVNTVTTTGAGMAARVTAIGWGATGQFPMSSTNALGQQTLFDYDFNFGGRTSVTDPNNITRTWHYDTFGRRDTETRPDGTHTVWSYSDCTSSGGCLIGSHAITLGVTEYNGNNTVLTDSTVFFDTLGRALVAKSRRLDGSYDRSQVQYDNFGRVSKSYMPCAWSALATPCPYTATSSFDALGRLTQIARAVSSVDSTVQTTTIQYAGRATTSVDAQGKSSLQIATVAGTIGRIRDHDGYGQDFISDPFGSLLSAVDSDGNTLFTAAYEYGIGAFQVDATDADLDVSTASGQHRHYIYNALGELTNWSDAKGQAFSQTYDALSRPRVRTEPDLVTTWTWDHSINNDRHSIGQLMDVSAASALGTYSEAYAFDTTGRPSSTAITIPAQGTYTYENAYDPNTGLLDTLTYPESTSSYRLKLKYTYQNGILQSVSDFNAPSTVFWIANAVNARGQVTQETLGNGVVTNRAIDPLTGWMSRQTSGVGGGNAFQNDGFLFDRVGNLTQRQNTNAGLTEDFYYDNLHRLDYSTLGGTTNLDMDYYPNGNIKSRSDIASGAVWAYDPSKFHAVRQAGSSSQTYTYDANGNATSRAGLGINWSSFNHPISITGLSQYDGSTETVEFSYNHNHVRWRAKYTGSTGVETTYMVGDAMEKVITVGNVADYRYFIYAGGAKVAIYSRTDAGVNTLRYLLEDNQGGVAAILSTVGGQVQALKESFTAYGNRRSTCTWSGKPTAGNLDQINSVTRHGYTWHTALGALGLNDMNGRVQDAITGRFLSPDPYVADPTSTQGYNRYTYVSNNPLTYVDPTGFLGQQKTDQSQEGMRLYEVSTRFLWDPSVALSGLGYSSFVMTGSRIPLTYSELAQCTTCGGTSSFYIWGSGGSILHSLPPAVGPTFTPGAKTLHQNPQQPVTVPGIGLGNAAPQGQSSSWWGSFKDWWSRSHDMSYCGRICAVNGDMPSRYKLTNGDLVMNTVNTATVVATALSGGTSLGATAVPRGFANAAQFEKACAELCSALTESGLTDFSIGVRGSSITGRSFATGAPFNAASDIDFFVASSAMRGFPINSYGLVYPSILGRAFPALGEWSAAWSNTLGRSVTVGGFATVPEGSVLLVVP